MNTTIGFASLVLLWYPERAVPFFLKFGVGGMYWQASSGARAETASAPAGSLGIGYDYRVGRNLSLTSYLNILATTNVRGESISEDAELKLNLIQLGMAISVH